MMWTIVKGAPWCWWTMNEEIYQINIEVDRATTVKAIRPEKPSGRGLLLAHGLNNDLDYPLLIRIGEAAAEIGWTTIRFNFLYREAGADQADSGDLLWSCFRRVHEDSLSRWSLNPSELVLGGKSLGARIAALSAGRGLKAPGLVHLGFPLHPPGLPEKSRHDLIRRVDPLAPAVFCGRT